MFLNYETPWLDRRSIDAPKVQDGSSIFKARSFARLIRMENHEEKKARGLYTKRHYLENNYREAQGKTLRSKCNCISKSTVSFLRYILYVFQCRGHFSLIRKLYVHRN